MQKNEKKYDYPLFFLQVKIEPCQKNSTKSQMVDDVLEILISSGELPPSAAQEPITPMTPNNQTSRSVVHRAEADSPAKSLTFSMISNHMETSQSVCDSSRAESKQPLSLPITSVTVELPHKLQQNLDLKENISKNFTVKVLDSETDVKAKILIDPQSIHINSTDPQPPQEVTSSGNTSLYLKVKYFYLSEL